MTAQPSQSDQSLQQAIVRSSPIYFFYFSFYGLFFPYLGRYLSGLGLDGQQIGLIMAAVTAANLYAPFLISRLSERSGKRVPLIRLCYGLMLLSYGMTQLSDSFWWLLLSFGLFGMFLSAALPLMEGVVIRQLGTQAEYYGRIRLWGSVGFVITVWGLGALLDVMPLQQLPLLGMLLCGAMLLATLPLSDRHAPDSPALSDHDPDQAPDKPQRQKTPTALRSLPLLPIAALLLCATLWQISMAPYNTFFDLHLQHHGYSGRAIGFLISLGAIAEILIFLFMVPIIRRFGSYWPFIVALALTALRWLLIGYYPDQLPLLLFAQLLHAFTFGTLHSIVIYQIAQLFPPERQVLGQGLYVALGNGLGLVLGNLIGGYTWSQSAGHAFSVSALMALLAMAIYGLVLRPDAGQSQYRTTGHDSGRNS